MNDTELDALTDMVLDRLRHDFDESHQFSKQERTEMMPPTINPKGGATMTYPSDPKPYDWNKDIRIFSRKVSSEPACSCHKQGNYLCGICGNYHHGDCLVHANCHAVKAVKEETDAG